MFGQDMTTTPNALARCSQEIRRGCMYFVLWFDRRRGMFLMFDVLSCAIPACPSHSVEFSSPLSSSVGLVLLSFTLPSFPRLYGVVPCAGGGIDAGCQLYVVVPFSFLNACMCGKHKMNFVGSK